MSDIASFRVDVRRVLDADVPRSLRGTGDDVSGYVWGGRKSVDVRTNSRSWLDIAVAHGWTAPSWPKEFGGGGLSPEQCKVLGEEIARLVLPPPLVGFGLAMIGPTLLQFGSEQLKREHLPQIVRGDIRWCQGYSEPNAGSDLASVQTSAVRDGDFLVVNGQKLWTSYGDRSDWMFMLVRTGNEKRKQEGITFLLVDLATPGVSTRPIRLISGASPFCETFFADARVPVRNVVGECNRGWTIAKALLGHERSMLASFFGIGSRRDRSTRGTSSSRPVVDLARQHLGAVNGRIADPILRDRIAQLSMDELCFELTVDRALAGTDGAHPPGSETSLFKVYGTELNQRREELMLSIRGPQALGWEGEGFSAEQIAQTREWLRSRGNTIEGGTSEIQLNIVAKHVLGLPD